MARRRPGPVRRRDRRRYGTHRRRGPRRMEESPLVRARTWLTRHRNLHRRRYVLRCRHEGVGLHVGVSAGHLWRRGRPREVHYHGAGETDQGGGPHPRSRPETGDRRSERPAISIDPARPRDGDPRILKALQVLSFNMNMVADPIDAAIVHTHTWYTNFAGAMAKRIYGAKL